MADYTKLKDLVGKDIQVKEVYGYKWKMWVPEEKRMHVSDDWVEGHRKVWQVLTDQGQLDVSDYQIRNMVPDDIIRSALADLRYTVKSNGKEGMEIRYYINLAKPPGLQNDFMDIPE